PTGGGTSLPASNYTPTAPRWKEAKGSAEGGLPFPANPVEPIPTLILPPEDAGEGRQQRGKLVFQRPRRVHQDHTGSIEAGRGRKWSHQKTGSGNPWHEHTPPA